MRRFDKLKNIQKANLLNEVRYLEYKGLIKEGNHENNDMLSENSIDLKISVLDLAKNNNGMFKSEKQGSFLKSMIDQREGLVGHTEHGRPYFAEYDDRGITKITVGTRPSELYWERKEQGILRPADVKSIKNFQRKIKELEKEIASREAGLKDGSYTDRYGVIDEKKKLIQKYKDAIKKIEGN
jgi:hypothetical protein